MLHASSFSQQGGPLASIHHPSGAHLPPAATFTSLPASCPATQQTEPLSVVPFPTAWPGWAVQVGEPAAGVVLLPPLAQHRPSQGQDVVWVEAIPKGGSQELGRKVRRSGALPREIFPFLLFCLLLREEDKRNQVPVTDVSHAASRAAGRCLGEGSVTL